MENSAHSQVTHPDPAVLGAYYDLWYQKVRGHARNVGYSPSDQYDNAVKQRVLRAEIESRLCDPRASWLDYGCGPAHLFKDYSATWECHRVGVDISPAIIAENRERFVHECRTEFFTLDGGYLDEVAPASFDCITCIEVLEHVYGVEDVVARFARWLRPGGTLIITTPNRRRAAPMLRKVLPERIALYLEDRVEHRSIDELEHTDNDLARFNVKTHFHEFAAPELKALFRAHGLQVVSTTLLALKIMPNRTFNRLARHVPGFVSMMETLDHATRHWPIGFFKLCLMMVVRRPMVF